MPYNHRTVSFHESLSGIQSDRRLPGPVDIHTVPLEASHRFHFDKSTCRISELPFGHPHAIPDMEPCLRE